MLPIVFLLILLHLDIHIDLMLCLASSAIKKGFVEKERDILCVGDVVVLFSVSSFIYVVSSS